MQSLMGNVCLYRLQNWDQLNWDLQYRQSNEHSLSLLHTLFHPIGKVLWVIYIIQSMIQLYQLLCWAYRYFEDDRFPFLGVMLYSPFRVWAFTCILVSLSLYSLFFETSVRVGAWWKLAPSWPPIGVFIYSVARISSSLFSIRSPNVSAYSLIFILYF